MRILDEICSLMLISREEAVAFSKTAPHRYKKYYISKRNSPDKRLIAHPSRELKVFQRILISLLSSRLAVHQAATAYVKGSNIKENAMAHAGNNYLLKMDLKNFFLSITPDVLVPYLSSAGVTDDVADIDFLNGILFWKLRRNSPLRLSVGAPSSPFISNVIMYAFDDAITHHCRGLGIIYTRYADDMTFSTSNKNVLFDIPKVVATELKVCFGNKIKINSEKTKFSSKKYNRHVTGVTLTNDATLSIGRDKKRTLRAGVHSAVLGLKDSKELMTLCGNLSHALNIEPEFIASLERKYGNDLLKRLLNLAKTKQIA